MEILSEPNPELWFWATLKTGSMTSLNDTHLFLNTAPSVYFSPKLSEPKEFYSKATVRMHFAMPNYQAMNLPLSNHLLAILPIKSTNFGCSRKPCMVYAAPPTIGTI
jgi:hypothetical protein